MHIPPEASSISHDFVQMYFENTGRSGGGPSSCEEKEKGCYIVQFEEPAGEEKIRVYNYIIN